MQPLRILMVTAEYAPFAKAGGLADMVAGLCKVLARRGHDVRVLLPRYRVPGFPALPLPVTATPLTSSVRIGGTHPPVTLVTGPAAPGQPVFYAVDAPGLVADGAIYGGGDDEGRRFALLAQAVLPLCTAAGFTPDVIHCHDWHTALVPLLLATPDGTTLRERGVRSLLTLHNIGYQGIFAGTLAADFGLAACEALLPEADRATGTINFLRSGIERADALTTVSPTHARELLTKAYGHGLDDLLRARSDRLTGILNGIDDEAWDPATDRLLPANFQSGDLAGRTACRHALLHRAGLDAGGLPVIGCVSRLAAQKGLHLLIEALPPFLASGRLAAVVLGSGDPTLTAGLAGLAARFPGRFAFIDQHDETLARLVYAGADAFTVPSLYEPCGLAQLYAMRYGCVPVVRATGGLRDTVDHFDPATGSGTGSVFQDADPGGLAWALDQVLAWHADGPLWARVQSNGMAADFSWRRQALAYEDLYRRLA
jgi:starch synthase